MGEIKITEMDADDAIGGSEAIPVSDAGSPKRITPTQLKNWIVDQIEAITAATATSGSDSIFMLQGGALKPLDVDVVVQYVLDSAWGKAAEASPADADTLQMYDADEGAENTITLAVLADYVKTATRAAILNLSDLDDGSGALSTDDYMLVTQGTTGKRIQVSDLYTAIYAGLNAYVTALDAVSSAEAGDVFYCIKSGVEKKVTLSQIATYLGNPVAGPATTTFNKIPQWADNEGTLKDGLAVDTEVGEVGDDGSVPTTQAVREGIDAALTGGAYDAVFNSITDGTMTCSGGVIANVVSLNGITATELAQLANINSALIAAIEWGYMATMDQPVATTDDVTFNSVAVTTSLSAATLSATTVTDGTWSTTAGAFTGVASIATPSSITMADGGWIGNAVDGPRVVFDTTSDYIELLGGNFGIGTTSPYGKVEIALGSALTVDMVNMGAGSLSFANGASGTNVPAILGKSNTNIGLFLEAGTNDSNSGGDMVFNVRENDNTDFATTTSAAFKFSRYATDLVTITRAGNVGIATTAIPVGGIGAAKLAIDGTVSNAAGPHLQFTASQGGGDSYPLMQVLAYAHDSVFLSFDQYWDGSWKSSDAGSNFGIWKTTDSLQFTAGSGNAAGAALSCSIGIKMAASGMTTFGSGTTSHALGAAGDVLVSGKLEVDGVGWFDQSVNIDNASQGDLIYTESGTSVAALRANFGFDQFLFLVDAQVGRQVIISDFDSRNMDHDHAVQTNPTLFVHSATDPDTANDEWWSITHDVTNAVYGLGSGVHSFTGGHISLISDSLGITFGLATDASIIYDGTNLVIDPAVVGTGYVSIGGATTGHGVSTDGLVVGGAFEVDGLAYFDETVFLSTAAGKNTVVGALSSLATDATDGFLYVPTCAGVPTGVPTSYAGKVALVFDASNNDLYVYDGGWISVALA